VYAVVLLALIDREPGRLVRRLRRPLSAARAAVGAGDATDEVVELSQYRLNRVN
jgi:hypothetical protein